MHYNQTRAVELLRKGSGQLDATFRSGQEEAIKTIVDRRSRLLVVEKTGWGKSFVYFIATRLMREQGAGPALLISPRLSLMRNQVEAAEKMGVVASKINSSNFNDWPREVEKIGLTSPWIGKLYSRSKSRPTQRQQQFKKSKFRMASRVSQTKNYFSEF
jgi:superfamily II DNA helicase RecQ